MHERVGTLRRDDAPDTVVPAESAGFELVARIDEPGRPVSLRSEADLIEARSQAWTWSIDDETWPAWSSRHWPGSGPCPTRTAYAPVPPHHPRLRRS